MKANLLPSLKRLDFERLEALLETLAEWDPGFDGWRSIALHTAAAAGAGDGVAVRRGCGDCHDTHRERYRELCRLQREARAP